MKAAIMEFYESHPGFIKNSIRKKYSLPPELAEDIEQETYIRAIERADQLRDDTNIAGWLFIIARNETISYIRRITRRSEVLKQVRDDKSPETSLELCLEQERGTMLDKAAEKLPRALKEVYTLVMEGYSFKEMGTELKISSASVSQRYFRMKNCLVEKMRGY